jgi:hypothetical protein
MSSMQEFLTPQPIRGHHLPDPSPAPPDADHMAGFNKAIQDLLNRWDRGKGQVTLQFTLQINPGNVIEYVVTGI